MEFVDMLTGAVNRLIAFLPNLIAALVILAIGLLIAKLLGSLTRRGMAALGLERRASVRRVVEHDAALARVPNVSGKIVFWLIALITIGVAVDALDLAWLSAGMARVLAYVPSVIAAAVIVLVGYLLGNFVFRQTARREGSLLLPRVLRAAIFVFAGFMAVQELGVATAIVTIAFTLLLGALAVAAAVAFGFGNRELAGRVTRDWYERRGTPERRSVTVPEVRPEPGRDEIKRDEPRTIPPH